ncbi:hypothetical protein EG68_07567 [Paragonimus skrjabini miyazakii]|uniref:Uncharacterized protein n=1 Tax=Paragonimus skrjabini miyazakii TaxID=59628 RepID=A0A8S9YTY7_9TREM|nr:hypothetical protein EG68_07567 [Paragonimus skrjabini miyazakii]
MASATTFVIAILLLNKISASRIEVSFKKKIDQLPERISTESVVSKTLQKLNPMKKSTEEQLSELFDYLRKGK